MDTKPSVKSFESPLTMPVVLLEHLGTHWNAALAPSAVEYLGRSDLVKVYCARLPSHRTVDNGVPAAVWLSPLAKVLDRKWRVRAAAAERGGVPRRRQVVARDQVSG